MTDRFAHLLLLTAERAWAHAMLIKEERSATPGPRALHRPVRKHIISRLRRACKTAQALCDALGDQAASGASDIDMLEARAYAFLVEGAWQFERQRWRESLVAYAVARIIYTVIMTTATSTVTAANTAASNAAAAEATTATVIPAAPPESVFRELFSNQIDPSMRYASYKAVLPQHRTVTGLARRALLQCDARLVPMLEQLDASVFSSPKLTRQAQKQPPSAEGATATTTTTTTGIDQLMSADGSSSSDGGIGGIGGAPQTIAWRGRTVRVDDAGVAVALAAVSAASATLARFFAAAPPASAPAPVSAQRLLLARDKAAAYDGVLGASHDAVEATKRAVAVLARAGVGASDTRMQALLVARTAAEYALVGWRVGRNRTLAGYRDGLASEDPRLGKKERLRRVARQVKRKAAAAASAAAAAPKSANTSTTTAMTAATAPKKTGSSTAKGLATLRERVALYDGILQVLIIPFPLRSAPSSSMEKKEKGDPAS
jgi:signal recognition particle subunit SRP68